MNNAKVNAVISAITAHGNMVDNHGNNRAPFFSGAIAVLEDWGFKKDNNATALRSNVVLVLPGVRHSINAVYVDEAGIPHLSKNSCGTMHNVATLENFKRSFESQYDESIQDYRIQCIVPFNTKG